MRGTRATIESFATWLGLKRGAVVQWLNDQRSPGPESVRVLAAKLGLEVYDTLGQARPDPLLFRLNAQWKQLPESDKIVIGRILDKLQPGEDFYYQGQLGQLAALKETPQAQEEPRDPLVQDVLQLLPSLSVRELEELLRTARRLAQESPSDDQA